MIWVGITDKAGSKGYGGVVKIGKANYLVPFNLKPTGDKFVDWFVIDDDAFWKIQAAQNGKIS